MRFRKLLIVLLIVSAVGLVGMRWLPDPPIVISKETTYITEPLGEDGLPDYFEYVRRRAKDGVTPENNAVVPLAKAVGPHEIAVELRDAWFEELGIERLPDEGDYYNEDQLYADGDRWLFERWQAIEASRESGEALAPEAASHPADRFLLAQGFDSDETDEEDFVGLFTDYIDRLHDRPWSTEICPMLAESLKRNEPALQLAQEAAARSHYYEPMIAPSRSLISTTYPALFKVLTLTRALAVRSMWHLGEGRFNEAHQDILTMHRLARLVDQREGYLIHVLVGYGADNIAHKAHVALTTHPDTPSTILALSLNELVAMGRWRHLGPAMNNERLMCLDSTVGLSKLGADYDHLSNSDGTVDLPSGWDTLKTASIDWNIVLRELNRNYDTLVDIANETDRVMRGNKLNQLDSELNEQVNIWRATGAKTHAFFNRNARSEAFAAILRSLFIPAIGGVTKQVDVANMRLDMTKIALALAVYHREHDAYPASLDALTPGLLETIPPDPFSGKPLVYERRGDGYLLYSVGEDGIDNGGSNADGTVVTGEWTTAPVDNEPVEFDIVIRVPVPPLTAGP